MVLNFSIDHASDVPIYEQISQQLRAMILQGHLAAGSRLPGMRELAKQLGVSLNTVHAACNLLIADRLLNTLRGSGTFVCELPEVASGSNLRTATELHGAAVVSQMDWSSFDFRLEEYIHPPPPRIEGLVNMAKATPDPALYPFERIKQVVSNMLWNPRELFFEYGHVQGYQPLVEHLERQMALRGVPMAPGENEIIITGGFQRALSILLQLLLRPGQRIAVENPTFSAIVNQLHSAGIPYVALEMDAEGLRTDQLERQLQEGGIAAVVSIPAYHNPTGITMSLRRRQALLKLAMQYGVPVIEDDWGFELRYDARQQQPLKAMDTSGHVIHVGSYSKSFLPGLRIGWITCPARLAPSLLIAKMGSDRVDNFFLQALLHEFITRGHYDRHLRQVLREYRRRWKLMCSLLEQQLPAGCSFTAPLGGFCIWLNLPPGWQSARLLPLARLRGVEFLPATYCTLDRSDRNALRLSFSRVDCPQIERGILALCQLLCELTLQPALVMGHATGNEEQSNE